MSYLRFESNVNYDLGKTEDIAFVDIFLFESNVNYDLGKTDTGDNDYMSVFESNVNYDLGKTFTVPIKSDSSLRAM